LQQQLLTQLQDLLLCLHQLLLGLLRSSVCCASRGPAAVQSRLQGRVAAVSSVEALTQRVILGPQGLQ
jgi:hypothetical protein